MNKYHNKKIVDLKKHLSRKDFEILKKLDIDVKDEIYTEYEFERLVMEMYKYYESENDIEGNEPKIKKHLADTKVGKEEYIELLNKCEKNK